MPLLLRKPDLLGVWMVIQRGHWVGGSVGGMADRHARMYVRGSDLVLVIEGFEFVSNSYQISGINAILYALVACCRALMDFKSGITTLTRRAVMHLHCPCFARGCFAASEAASQPPIGIKWYYQGSTSYLGDLGAFGPWSLGRSVSPW